MPTVALLEWTSPEIALRNRVIYNESLSKGEHQCSSFKQYDVISQSGFKQ